MTVAARVWSNPDGVTQQATGPFSRSISAWAALGLQLSDTEKAMLSGYATSVRPALWTQPTTRGEVDTASVYVEVAGSDEPLPVSLDPW